MHRVSCFALLLACGGSSPAPSGPGHAVDNTVADEPPAAPTSCEPPPGRFRGCVLDTAGQPLAGATLVFTPADGSEELTTLTDERGAWAIDIAGTDFRVAVYYADIMAEKHLSLDGPDQPRVLGDIVLDLTQNGGEVIRLD